MAKPDADHLGRWALSTIAGALLIWVLVHLRPVPGMVVGLAAALVAIVLVVREERRKPQGQPIGAFGLLLALAVVGGFCGWLLAEFQHVLFTK